MTRLLIRILFFLISFSFVAEHYLACQMSAISSVVDDSSEEKNEPIKEKKGGFEEKYLPRHLVSSFINIATFNQLYCFNESLFSSGFFECPYTPPDLM